MKLACTGVQKTNNFHVLMETLPKKVKPKVLFSSAINCPQRAMQCNDIARQVSDKIAQVIQPLCNMFHIKKLHCGLHEVSRLVYFVHLCKINWNIQFYFLQYANALISTVLQVVESCIIVIH